jgi:hypothetical protein
VKGRFLGLLQHGAEEKEMDRTTKTSAVGLVVIWLAKSKSGGGWLGDGCGALTA